LLFALVSIISGFANEVTDIVYYSKVPFANSDLEFWHFVFLLIRPALIMMIFVIGILTLYWPWLAQKIPFFERIEKAERPVFPIVVYFSINRALDEN
jgi:hypothetical protein